MATIIESHGAEFIPAVRELFEEYGASLPFSLCFQGFERELATLPGRYGPPTGTLLSAMIGPRAAGCVALREIGPGICEMKRLYVRPEARGAGLGRALAVRIIDEGRSLGYERMRLDTSADMVAAQRLYEDLGFRRIERYNDDPIDGTIWMELSLRDARVTT